MLTFSNYDADATELFEVLGWKNLARQQEIHNATMMFRCLHGLASVQSLHVVTLLMTSGILEISSIFHYCELFITEKD